MRYLKNVLRVLQLECRWIADKTTCIIQLQESFAIEGCDSNSEGKRSISNVPSTYC